MVYLSFGGNVGNVEETFSKAKKVLANKGLSEKSSSSLYRTAAWGKEDQADFLNQVIAFDTDLLPKEIITLCLQTEIELGRIRHEKWGPRVIDIDVLFIDQLVYQDDDLIVPHPEIQKRSFILTPMAEIAQHYVHPILGKSMSALLKDCLDELEVQKLA